MKRIILVSFLFFFGQVNFSFAQPAKHVVLISIDGFRPDFYKDPSWGMVNLRQMMHDGVYAEEVNPIFPSVTFPNHTTILTGVSSAKHGIYYNDKFDPAGSGKWHWYYKDIRVPTLWDVVNKAGMTSVSVNWPVSVGAPVDYNIPIIKESGKSRIEAIKDHTTPKGLFEEVQKNATGQMGNVDFSMQDDYLFLDQNIARITAYLIRKHKPVLTTVRLSLTDHFEHKQGRDGDKVKKVVAGADRAIKTVVDGIERAGISKSTAIIVTGDHGFVNKHTSIAPNVWLTQAGLIENRKKGDWKAQFQTTGGSAFLKLQNADDMKTLQKVKGIINKLPENQRKLFHIIEGDKLDRVGIDPNVLLALSAKRGIAFSGSFKGKVVKATAGGTHGYVPNFHEIKTGFVGSGVGFKQGVIIPVMDLEDISPMVARLLGIKFETADGMVYPGIFSE